MDLELHQLTLRFERLRKRRPREERSLLVSLTEIGQQLPVVVIQEAPSFILIDGYKRPQAALTKILPAEEDRFGK